MNCTTCEHRCRQCGPEPEAEFRRLMGVAQEIDRLAVAVQSRDLFDLAYAYRQDAIRAVIPDFDRLRDEVWAERLSVVPAQAEWFRSAVNEAVPTE